MVWVNRIFFDIFVRTGNSPGSKVVAIRSVYNSNGIAVFDGMSKSEEPLGSWLIDTVVG